MKYPIADFYTEDQQLLHRLVELFPLACLISVEKNEVFTSYIPLRFKEGKMVGHVDANNPQVKLLKGGKKVKLVFSGPDAYISPSAFNTNELPTYNSIRVEAEGCVFGIKEEDLKSEIQSLTQIMEAEKQAYVLTESEKRLQTLMPYIHGFTIEVTPFIGRIKMSQDKRKAHFEKAKEIVKSSSRERIEKALDLIQKQSFTKMPN